MRLTTAAADRFAGGLARRASIHVGTLDNGQKGPKVMTEEEYNEKRIELSAGEAARAFDHDCFEHATKAEMMAHKALLRMKAVDAEALSGKEPHVGYGNQRHVPFPGDHYLSNVEYIETSRVLEAARHLPKGAHLHIHFNACLKPSVLLELASQMTHMFITSDRPLTEVHDDGMSSKSDKNRKIARLQNFFLCEIQFSILPITKRDVEPSLFSKDYQAREPMRFRMFLDQFPKDVVGEDAMTWLASKLVFDEQETYDIPQTPWGAWERFNGRTRMMKGLFNYVSVYKTYTRLFLEDLLKDNIQYAEIRPNFMTTNQLWNDEGTAQMNNEQIVQLIVDVCKEFQETHAGTNFQGIKIIYCTPRSFPRSKVEAALNECIDFKIKFGDYIAGFDLVGEESKGQPLKTFVPEFLAFQAECRARGLDIPFLFHCGETLDMGTDVDGNLLDALLLKAKRIGHGFALPRHPLVMERMKEQKVCVEVCPISNEVLGLTPRIGNHAVYSLLANNMPCTINSDNGTLFQSTLSHDFYQVLVGKSDMGLFGWRQLAEWSLEHACLGAQAQEAARKGWLDAWREFVVWLIEEDNRAANGPETAEFLRLLAHDKEAIAKPSPSWTRTKARTSGKP